MKAPRVISLYSGAGGLDIGFVMAGFNPIFSNDIDADAISTYRSWLARASQVMPHLNEDGHRITTGDIRAVPDLPGEGDADIVIGGPPCQGFSVAGKMDPNDPRSRHVWDFLGMVRRVQPEAFVMENVKALASNKRWSGLSTELVEKAEELGYKTSISVLNASHYDVPQRRERMFLIGIRNGSRTMPPPTPTSMDNPPTLREVLSRMPEWGKAGNDSICIAKVTPAKSPVLRKSAYAGMLFNGQGRPMNLDAPAPTLPASMGGNRTPVVDQLQISGESPSWIEEYHGRLMSGERPVNDVPSRMRRITVEEAAAIQTFPPEMEWVGPQSSKYRQIGNAVPPVLGYHVASALRDWLDYPDFIPPDNFLGLRVPNLTA